MSEPCKMQTAGQRQWRQTSNPETFRSCPFAPPVFHLTVSTLVKASPPTLARAERAKVSQGCQPRLRNRRKYRSMLIINVLRHSAFQPQSTPVKVSQGQSSLVKVRNFILHPSSFSSEMSLQIPPFHAT